MGEHTPAPTPGRAVYGFALFLVAHTLFIIYVIWAFVPTKILENELGLFYLPDKYFALYIPVLILCAVTVFAFFIYPALNFAMTPDVDRICTVRDKNSILRCKFHDAEDRRCDNKVATNLEKEWRVPDYCALHVQFPNEPEKCKLGEELISNACDCPEYCDCLLRSNSDHLNSLRKRFNVPSVSDLDLSEVCFQVFDGCG